MAPIISGLLGALIVLILMRAGHKPARREGAQRALGYGRGTRWVVMLMIPETLSITYAASHARPDQIIGARIVATLFGAATIFLIYHVFMVRLAYDDTALYYSSPLAGSHVIPWKEVRDIGWSSLWHSYYVCTAPVRRIWWSSMMEGYHEFGRFLEEKFPSVPGC